MSVEYKNYAISFHLECENYVAGDLTSDNTQLNVNFEPVSCVMCYVQVVDSIRGHKTQIIPYSPMLRENCNVYAKYIKKWYLLQVVMTSDGHHVASVQLPMYPLHFDLQYLQLNSSRLRC